jgi:hypothetical protein
MLWPTECGRTVWRSCSGDLLSDGKNKSCGEMIQAIERLRGVVIPGRGSDRQHGRERRGRGLCHSCLLLIYEIMLDFINFAQFFASYDGYDDVGDVRTP